MQQPQFHSVCLHALTHKHKSMGWEVKNRSLLCMVHVLVSYTKHAWRRSAALLWVTRLSPFGRHQTWLFDQWYLASESKRCLSHMCSKRGQEFARYQWEKMSFMGLQPVCFCLKEGEKKLVGEATFLGLRWQYRFPLPHANQIWTFQPKTEWFPDNSTTMSQDPEKKQSSV